MLSGSSGVQSSGAAKGFSIANAFHNSNMVPGFHDAGDNSGETLAVSHALLTTRTPHRLFREAKHREDAA
jgi:hypothetical protein